MAKQANSKNMALVAYAGIFSIVFYKADKEETFDEILSKGFFYPVRDQVRQNSIVYVCAGGEMRQLHVVDNEGTVKDMGVIVDIKPDQLITDSFILQVAEQLKTMAKDADTGTDELPETAPAIPDLSCQAVADSIADKNFGSIAVTLNSILAVLRSAKLVAEE